MSIPQKSFSPALFNPPFWLSNPHLQTILPKFFAPDVPTYRRELERDSLAQSNVAYDYYDAPNITLESDKHHSDTVNNNAVNRHDLDYNIPLVVLFHGMEGSSDSHYARALAHHVHAQGWHFVVAHFRSCGGVPASGLVFYNAGDTGEVHHMLSTLSSRYKHIYAVGVSLGGNALAKYMGEYQDNAVCQAAVAISAPVDMSSAAINMHRFIGQKIYTPYLLNPIIKKALANEISESDIVAMKAAKRISDFDHIFTAPRHGYRSNNEYYQKASALPYLIDVTKPLLLISSKDDPFLGFTATANDVSNTVTILDTEHGGHVGFLRYQSAQSNVKSSKFGHKRFDIDWVPQTISAYFKSLDI